MMKLPLSRAFTWDVNIKGGGKKEVRHSLIWFKEAITPLTFTKTLHEKIGYTYRFVLGPLISRQFFSKRCFLQESFQQIICLNPSFGDSSTNQLRINLLRRFPLTPALAAPSPTSFVQYFDYLSSAHVQTIATLTDSVALSPNWSTWAVPLILSFFFCFVQVILVIHIKISTPSLYSNLQLCHQIVRHSRPLLCLVNIFFQFYWYSSVRNLILFPLHS